MVKVYDFHKKVDNDNEGIEISGSVKVYCGKKSDTLHFKSTFEWGFLGSSLKKFEWKSIKRAEHFEDTFVEFGNELLKMQQDYLQNYDLRDFGKGVPTHKSFNKEFDE
tara:strand:+ start:87 stop:410 length:324 start_codon:yes stop_codon:yes gene_type:complete